jgi:VWFA-related protein
MRVTFKDLQRRVVDDEIMVYAIGVPARIPSAYNQTYSPGMAGPGLQGAMKFEPPDPDLRKIAEESGGGYFELKSNDDLDATFERVADELHRQYLLGFSPARLDTRTHDIEVRVKDRDVKVRARKNYRAAAGR